MKSKIILWAILGMLHCFTLNAKEVDIPLNKSTDTDNEWLNGEDYRSLSIIPQAIYDGNAIHIYSDMTTNNITITIKDEIGNAIYSNTNVTSSRCHTFYIGNLPQGCYLLELEIGDCSFYGYFSIQDDI